MKIDDIDIEAINTPMRCLTPTPSTSGSTILAGHLDFSLGEMETTLNNNLPTESEDHDNSEDDEDDDDEMFAQ